MDPFWTDPAVLRLFVFLTPREWAACSCASRLFLLTDSVIDSVLEEQRSADGLSLGDACRCGALSVVYGRLRSGEDPGAREAKHPKATMLQRAASGGNRDVAWVLGASFCN
uniref:Uncharacterized protein n=1 Tax=Oxyrrhis marina TaxID=2969 RepID=A0A7S3XGR9_OXYMA